MKSFFFTAFLLTIAQISNATNGTPEVKTSASGPLQYLMHVEPTHKYLILPVQESVEDSKIELMVNGRTVKTFYVRLAKDTVDYTVPLNLNDYKDRKIVLRVTAPKHSTEGLALHAATNKKKKKKDLWISDIKMSDTFDITGSEPYRPAYHHTPPYGWMNDPNGMVFKDGKWHLYYQWNPYGSKWQNMTWGHSSSSDLINWDYHPAAIEPDDLGTIFSGSAAIDKNNTAGFGENAIVALYTSAGDYQIQSLAGSVDDGMTFSMYADNPVITLPTEARDPNFFFNEKTGLWNLVLAHALEKEVLVFSSADLKEWVLESQFGKGLGARDGVWECPDLFELPVEGSGEKKWMMIVNLNPGGPFGGSATQYFIGDFDGKTFTPDITPGGYVPAKWLDFGKDFYATVTWSDTPDNRRTAIGWMSNWQYADKVPTLRFRSANTLPREIGLFQASDGQIYASSVPSPELKALRGKPGQTLKNTSLSQAPKVLNLPEENNGICEINMTLTSQNNPVRIILKNNNDESALLVYDPVSNIFTFDRTESGLTDFSEDFPAITAAPTFSSDGKLQLTLFIDRSSIEIFGNNGKFAMTNLVFPEMPYTQMEISTIKGSATLNLLEIYPILTKQTENK